MKAIRFTTQAQSTWLQYELAITGAFANIHT